MDNWVARKKKGFRDVFAQRTDTHENGSINSPSDHLFGVDEVRNTLKTISRSFIFLLSARVVVSLVYCFTGFLLFFRFAHVIIVEYETCETAHRLMGSHG